MVRNKVVGLIALFLLFGNYNFQDVSEAVNYYGLKIFPSNPTVGAIIIFLTIFYILFTEEIN
ncbi:MAG: hypothetical protein J7L15_05785, partial [Clostridiales bacterium]|nr:hypothetical protein [Clostridiales bacterium]